MSEADLIRACAESNDSAVWQEFVSRFHRPISLSIIRTAYQWGEIPAHVVDDLVQDTYLKLCSNKCYQLLEFATRHPDAILGYIKTIAVNVAHDHFKALHSQKRGSERTDQLSVHVELGATGGHPGNAHAIERDVLLKEIDRTLAACSDGPDKDRDRLIFWLYYRQGMTAKAIAAIPAVGLTPKGVESAIHRLIRIVRERIVMTRSGAPHTSERSEKGLRPAESY